MKINDVNKVKDISSSKIKKTSSSGVFSSYLNEVMQPTAESVSGAAPLSVADAIFATQMVGEEEEKELKKQLLQRGNDLLEKLEEIRNGLLRGYLSKDKLIEISRFVKNRKLEAQDDRLNELIEEIELRVEVELAKLMK
jgi:hypothetical protein